MRIREKRQRKDSTPRFALTLLYAIIIFGILLITLIAAGVVLYLLMHFGFLKDGNKLGSPNHVIFYMGAISLGIGAFLTMLTSELPLKPINRVITQLKKLAKGDFSARLSFGAPIGKHPTIVELTDNFNMMAEELENTELLRSDFINNFSHEFKTPIVSIAGFAKLLKRGNLSEQQKEEYLNIIEEESMRLAYMATNVLNLTKVENQTILTDVSSFNLSEQIRSSVLLLENRWVKKNIEFSLEFEEHQIEANEELLKQVWINLVDNAVKFSPDYGLIVIKIAADEDFYKISVANSGTEIPPESMKKIFNKFYQADESHASEGNGVGLAIVKRITELHNGEITVQSKNEITTFTVKLPKTID